MCLKTLTLTSSHIVCSQFIPMPVLYGVFLYMGVASLNGVQVSSCVLLKVMLPVGRKN